jgi:hypothetical protein
LRAFILINAMSVLLIAADQLCRLHTAVGELDVDIAGAFHHMMIGENVTFFRDDDAGAEGGPHPCRRRAATAAKKEIKWIDECRALTTDTAKADAHYGRDDRIDKARVFCIERGEHLDILQIDFRTIGRSILLHHATPAG